MTSPTENPLFKKLDCIKDPRHHNKHHLLHDMLLITLCAVISGADAWTQVAAYGRSKFEWFNDFLELPNGIPSHDTFDTFLRGSIRKASMNSLPNGYKIIPNLSKVKPSQSMRKTLRASHD